MKVNNKCRFYFCSILAFSDLMFILLTVLDYSIIRGEVVLESFKF
jgi:hypothetical protein